MSVGSASRHVPSPAFSSKFPARVRQTPSPSASAADADPGFEPCAATSQFVLYAQRNLILVLHHDTLAIERRFDLHREDIVWVVVDNASERGAGRLAVSYDTGNTAIVWDILAGAEVARFSAYERMRIACFMRNGNIAFGNDQGSIILFEPATSEHISARTIFDPITALAPATDCRTFAIGYLNGSILIATLQPSFTILHTLTTSRVPARIAGLGWHGSSSKQKTDMLATQTSDGDLRVWSVPKGPSHEAPNIIRVLQRVESNHPGPCWFAWSKNGRIVQFADGETRVWDVRTKRVSWEGVPTGDNITAIASYGPNATLFTLNRHHFLKQFDVTPNGIPFQKASVQHIPSSTPPTPPMTLEARKTFYSDSRPPSVADRTFMDTDDSSMDEGPPRSPMRRIQMEMDSLDALDSELRDKVGPLSPTSSRASSQSSRSSHSRRRDRRYLYDQPSSSRASSTTGFGGTEFSIPTPVPRVAHDNMSIRSVSSYASHTGSRFRHSGLRREVIRSPEEQKSAGPIDLFPITKGRLEEVPFRTPQYGNEARTPEVLQGEMLSVVFGWNDTIESMIHEEIERHQPGSAGAVLLSKWLGGSPADAMSNMLGSDGMSSSDWMLLALSSINPESQKKVGETFVQRLLEKGDVHPAVAILLGLGETNDAVEVYVSQHYWLEALLLACLSFPTDWQRTCYLLRKWGESCMKHGQAEIAVRVFSCTSIETSEPWFPTTSQPQARVGAKLPEPTMPASARHTTSPPISPPSRSGSNRLTAKNASLRLITSFGDPAAAISHTLDDRTPVQLNGGITPIAQSAMPQSAMSPGGVQPWLRSTSRTARDPISAINMTPMTTRKRFPSISDIERVKQETAQHATPITAARDTAPLLPSSKSHSRRTSSVSNLQAPDTAIHDSSSLPSPALEAFTRLREQSTSRTSKDRKPDGLSVQVLDTKYVDARLSSESASRLALGSGRSGTYSPALTEGSLSRGRVGAIDDYINSVEAARDMVTRETRMTSRQRGESKRRTESHTRRGTSRARETSEVRRGEVRYIKPAKRSPSSPVPMSPEEIAEATKATRTDSLTAAVDGLDKAPPRQSSPKSVRSLRVNERRPSLRVRTSDDVVPKAVENTARSDSPKQSRGRSHSRERFGSEARSPSVPIPRLAQSELGRDDTFSEGHRVRRKAHSRARDRSREGRVASSSRRDRSVSRGPGLDGFEDPGASELGTNSMLGEPSVISTAASSVSNGRAKPRGRGLRTKELAAKELEDRRLSLARRPSAPQIPMPGDAYAARPVAQRTQTDHGPGMLSSLPRSMSAEPEQMMKYNKNLSAPFGLPATPRAMRHPRHMGSDLSEQDDAPPMPFLPENASMLSSVVSTRSNLSSNLSSTVNSGITGLTSNLTSNVSVESPLSARQLEGEDDVGPLLPATVFSQKSFQPPTRPASAPIHEYGEPNVHQAYKSAIPSSSRQGSSTRTTNIRKIAPPTSSIPQSAHPSMAGPTSIDEALALHGQRYPGPSRNSYGLPAERDPPLLPELQHLANPPIPPPPPPPPQAGLTPSYIGQPRVGSGVINIVIDEMGHSTVTNTANEPSTLPSTTYPQPMDRAMTTSPQQSRRGRGSGESASIGTRIRGIGDRMRSTSRNRTKPDSQHRAVPYESVVPPMPQQHAHKRVESFHRAKSPYEKAMAAQMGSTISSASESTPFQLPLAPSQVSTTSTFFSSDGNPGERTVPPPQSLPTRTGSAAGNYGRNREIRANMPPDMLQQGTYPDDVEFL